MIFWTSYPDLSLFFLFSRLCDFAGALVVQEQVVEVHLDLFEDAH
jgi:hypothetical protein